MLVPRKSTNGGKELQLKKDCCIGKITLCVDILHFKTMNIGISNQMHTNGTL